MYGRYLILGICLVLLGDSLDAKQNNDWQNQQREQTKNQYQQNGFLESNSAAKPSEMINIDENPPQSDVYMGSGDQVVDDDYSGAGIDDEDSEGSAGPNTDDEDDEKGSGVNPVVVTRKPVQAKPQEPTDPQIPPSEPEEEVFENGNSVEREDIKEIDNRLNNMPGGIDPSVEIATVPPETNDVEMLESKGSDMTRSNVVMTQPGILAGIVGGAVVGLLCAVLLVMFIVYRMRKKDEGSYALDEPKRSPSLHTYSRATNREFYA